ncbi:hypothetical protein HID58_062594 [Brassica napus]|uniref:Uncharacterized protein n=1 Tax=Brassica napus TaxID=3708 RepID=A0ABQ8A228_BRANA|nr:hypothetical protein HID58_062594 [Brassica napus]
MATIMTKLLRLSTVSGKFQHKMRQTTPYSGSVSVERVSDYLGKVTILSLGPLFNLAIMIVIFGGAFFALGNINPPSEANIEHPLNLLFNLLSMIKCRPEAADVGFISGADITVGINISTQLKLTGVCLHDPLSFVEAVRPDLFKYKKGGICVGHRLMDQALKRSYYINCNLHRKRKNHRWNRSNEQSMGEIFTNICDVDNKCRQSFGIYQSVGGEA